jgi:prepilin-type N-terminal cleavage/methylation domain-containing protein
MTIGGQPARRRSVAAARGFTLIEVVAVAAMAAVVAAAAAALGVRTINDIQNSATRMAALEFVQRERSSHVSRGVYSENMVLCAAVGNGPCTAAGGDTLVSYRALIPSAFPNPNAAELDRVTFRGAQFNFVPGPALFTDAFARSTDAGGVPQDTVLTMQLMGGQTADLLIRLDGVVVPSFPAPAKIEVVPVLSNLGARTTPNPTPAMVPTTGMPSRRVFLE